MTTRSLPHTTDTMRVRVGEELSVASRVGHTALLLASLGIATTSGALLATEEGLPMRTTIAFALVTTIGCAWAVYATWVLMRRRVLYARHRVIAGRMAVTFSALFAAGSAALWWSGAVAGAWWGATAVGVLMLAVAIVMLRQAHRRVDALLRRREALEQLLGVEPSR